MFAPGRILIQNDYWKDVDALKIIESENETGNSSGANSKKQRQSQASSKKSNDSKTKIDFSIFDEKPTKYSFEIMYLAYYFKCRFKKIFSKNFTEAQNLPQLIKILKAKNRPIRVRAELFEVVPIQLKNKLRIFFCSNKMNFYPKESILFIIR